MTRMVPLGTKIYTSQSMFELGEYHYPQVTDRHVIHRLWVLWYWVAVGKSLHCYYLCWEKLGLE